LIEWVVCLKLIVPHGLSASLTIIDFDCVAVGVGVHDSHHETTCVSKYFEVKVLGRSSCEVDFIEFCVVVDHGWESLLSFLAAVEAIPAVVHKGVESIVEALSFSVAEVWVPDVNWSDITVHSIIIKTVKDHNSEFIIA